MSSPGGLGATRLVRVALHTAVAGRTLVVALALVACGCAVFSGKPGAPPAIKGPDPLPVKTVPEDVVIAVWSEPSRLPPHGGQTHIKVRLQKKGGAPFGGVEVRLSTSAGNLFSQGKVLVTDATGHTRDRLSTRKTAHVTLNAGGTVYRFRVPVGEPPTD
jgi:hypothetical protein